VQIQEAIGKEHNPQPQIIEDKNIKKLQNHEYPLRLNRNKTINFVLVVRCTEHVPHIPTKNEVLWFDENKSDGFYGKNYFHRVGAPIEMYTLVSTFQQTLGIL